MATKIINSTYYSTFLGVDNSPAKIGHLNTVIDDINAGGSFLNTNTITTAAINTAYTVATPTTNYASGLFYASNTIVLVEPGTYSFDFTLQIFKNNTTTEGSLTAWLALDGVNQDYTANTLSLAISSQIGIMTLHSHITTTTANSRVGLWYAANSTDMQLRTSAASAPYPAIAAVSLEVDKVR